MTGTARSLQPPAREACLFLLPLNASLVLTLADTILSDDFGRRTDSLELIVPAGILAIVAIYLLGRSHGRLDAGRHLGAEMERVGEHDRPIQGDGRVWRVCQLALTLATVTLIALILYARVSPVL